MPQERVLEHALDVARNIGGNERDARRPHQGDHDVPRPCRRIPHRDEAFGPVSRKAITDQNKTDNGYQREQTQIRTPADTRYQRGAPLAHGDKHMRAKKHNEADDFDSKAHG